MRKQTPAHLLVENSQSHISRLAKSLNALRAKSDFREFDECMDHLDAVLNILVLHGRRMRDGQ